MVGVFFLLRRFLDERRVCLKEHWEGHLKRDEGVEVCKAVVEATLKGEDKRLVVDRLVDVGEGVSQGKASSSNR